MKKTTHIQDTTVRIFEERPDGVTFITNIGGNTIGAKTKSENESGHPHIGKDKPTSKKKEVKTKTKK